MEQKLVEIAFGAVFCGIGLMLLPRRSGLKKTIHRTNKRYCDRLCCKEERREPKEE